MKSVWLLLITSGFCKGTFRHSSGNNYVLPMLAFGSAKKAKFWMKHADSLQVKMGPVRFDVAKGKRKRGGK